MIFLILWFNWMLKVVIKRTDGFSECLKSCFNQRQKESFHTDRGFLVSNLFNPSSSSLQNRQIFILFGANVLQLSWVFSMLTETSQTPGPLHRNQSSEWKGPSEHVSCVCGLKQEDLGSVYRTESCDTFLILRLAFIWADKTEASHTSHIAPHFPTSLSFSCSF